MAKYDYDSGLFYPDDWEGPAMVLPREVQIHQREILKEKYNKSRAKDEKMDEQEPHKVVDTVDKDARRQAEKLGAKISQMDAEMQQLKRALARATQDTSDRAFTDATIEQDVANKNAHRYHLHVKRSFQLVGCGLGGQIVTAPIVGVITQSIGLVIALGVVSIALYLLAFLMYPAGKDIREADERKIKADANWMLALQKRQAIEE